MAKDPYNHKEKYLKWKEKVKFGIPDISKANSGIIKKFINDMEFGLNISVMSKRGARSYIRLNTLRDKMLFFAKAFKERLNLDCVTDVTEEDLLIETTKTELQKQVDNLARSNEILKEENQSMKQQMEKILAMVKELDKMIG